MPLKNQLGFSLPEITIALGLLGGISVVTMRLVQNSANNEAMLKGRAEIQKAAIMVKNTLNDPENCRRSLRLMRVPATGTANITKPTDVPATNFDGTPNPDGLYQRLRDGSFKRIIVANSNYNGFRTGAITLARAPNGTPNVAELAVQFRVELKASMFWDSDTTNDRIITEKIPVLYSGTVSGADTIITDCGPVLSEVNNTAKKKLCDSLGAMAIWESGRCRFVTKKCPYGEGAFEVTATGDLTCVRLDTKLDTTQLLDTTSCSSPTGTYRIGVNATGKLKVDCL